MTETVSWLTGQQPDGPTESVRHWLLDKGEFIIARRPPVDLLLSNSLVSRRLGKLFGVWIDPASDEVWVDTVRLETPLSLSQLALLRLLYACLDQPVSTAEIIAAVWPDEDPAGVSKQALVKRLRDTPPYVAVSTP